MGSTRRSERGDRRHRSRGALTVLAIILGAVFTTLLVLAMIWPPINDVTTGQTPQYPDVRPQVLRYSPELVVERAAEVVMSLDGWTLVRVDRDGYGVDAEARSAVLGFVDDVSIWVHPYGAGSLVNVRSRSRVGMADFGQNARNIRAFQSALVDHLELARRAPPRKTASRKQPVQEDAI